MTFFLSYSLVLGDFTYFDYDKLVFGNAGGFEMTPSSDGKTYFLQVLNISGSDDEYISKGLNIDGKFKSIIPSTMNVYTQDDLLEFGASDEASFDDEYFEDVPEYNDSSTLPTNKVFFVGEMLGKFMLLNENEIEGITVVTGNNYETTDIYLQEENGAVFTGLNSNSMPVLSVFPSINQVAYMGINTTEPAEAVTIVGDFAVSGNFTLSTPVGVFDSNVNYPGTNFSPLTFEKKILSTYEFTTPPYVTQNVMVIGMISGRVVTVGYEGAWFHAWFNVYTDDDDDDNWDLYDDPLQTETIASRSYREVDGSLDFYGYHIAPQFTALFEPKSDGSARTYKIEVIGTNGNDVLQAEDYVRISTVNINIMGLPYSSYEGTFDNFTVEQEASLTENSTNFGDIDGNFYTNQIVAFGSGGGIVESGNSLVLTSGTEYLNFRAGAIEFGSFHYIDSLQVFDESANQTYPFKVGTSSKLGIDSYEPSAFYSGLVTSNIQTLTSGGVADTSGTLSFLSDIYIGEGFSVKTDGVAPVNVEIGDVLSDTDYALNINGNILFTGGYKGTYGVVKYQYLDGNSGTTAVVPNGYVYDDNPDDYITIDLEGESNWNVMVFAQISANVLGVNEENLLWIIIEDQSDTSIQYISEPTIIMADNTVSHRHTFYNTYSKGGIPSGTYNVYIKLKASYTIHADEDDILDSDGDGDTDFTFLYSRLTGSLGVIATPGN
jgi:hypothetical protein